MEICYTCLSRDRILFPLRQFKGFFKDTKMINMECNEYMTGNICWECRHVIEKFSKFKKQVLKAQNLLKMLKFEEIKSLSSLFVNTKHFFDTEYHYTSDPLTIPANTTKTEEVSMKQEDTETSTPDITDDKIESDDHQIPELSEDIYVETFEKPAVKAKKIKTKAKVYIKIINSNEIMEKFRTVVYTEEEMIKKREEKRNQPNFKKIPFKCDLCVLGFTKKETYEQHLEKKHDENIGPIECDVCHVRFASQKSAARHRSQHYVCYRCKFCSYSTSQQWSAVNHCRVKHGADTRGRVHCSQCDVVASTPEELADHTRTKHSLHCNECGEKFKGKNTLRTHKIRIHGSDRQFQCEVCSKRFARRSRLTAHRARHSAALGARLAYCSTCRAQFCSVPVYRSHLRNSARHAQALYPCPECDKKFASKVYLTKHRNFYHLHKSKYKCDTCDKLFISNWRLKNHKQKHHGLSRSRDHACNTCGKKFYTLSTLRGHELTHSDQRSYMCEDCGDTFKQRPALYTHHRLVHRVNNSKA